MRFALLGSLLLLLSLRAAGAEVPRMSAFEVPLPSKAGDRPTELPPLLAVPPPGSPMPDVPRGPSGEYDPGYFYLPERSPDGPRRPEPCGPAGRIWIGPGLELAWIKPAAAPPLLRLGTTTGLVLYGGQNITTPMQAGFSLTTGVWLNERRTIGFDAGFFFVNGAGSDTVIGPTNDATLVLPLAGIGAWRLADSAAGYLGAFQAGINTHFATADVNFRNNLLCEPGTRVDALVGYRYGRIADDYEAYGKRLGPDGEIVRFRDEAHTATDFHGGQVGLAGDLHGDRWFLTATGKVAFGVAFSEASLMGKFRVNGTVVPFGPYARPGLSGTQDASQFAVMPVAGFTFGRRIGEHGRISLGYNFLYLNRVARGPDLFATSLAPVLERGELPTTDFWVQSASLALEWRY